jgi:hypothetical protein
LHELQRLPAVANYDESRCDQTLDALTETTQVPTLRLIGLSLVPPYSRGDWEDALARTPEAAREEWRRVGEEGQFDSNAANEPFIHFAEFSMFLVERMRAKGIPIGAGTDTPIGIAIPGYSLHSELDMLVRAGLSPIEALADRPRSRRDSTVRDTNICQHIVRSSTVGDPTDPSHPVRRLVSTV